MIYLVVLIYVLVSVLITLSGIGKQNEILKILLISLLLTPISGGIYILFKKKNYKRVLYYYCSDCDYIFPVKMKYCPICKEKGVKIKLSKYKSPYTFSKKIQHTSFI